MEEMKRFYKILENITLKEIATITEAKLDPKYNDYQITNLGSLEHADKQSVIYLALGFAVSSALDKSTEYKEKLKHINAGACLIDEKNVNLLPDGIIPLVVKDPKLAFIKLTHKFYQDKSIIFHGISEHADIAPSVKFKNKSTVHIGPFSVIEDGVEIGENTYIGSGVKVKAGTIIGDNCIIRENAVISHSIIGNYVNIGECSVIGGNGFGWHSGSHGHMWVPQLGRVILEDYVDIGVNSCVDRGTIVDTVIGSDTKIDNLVQIGHNVRIGKHCIIAGKSGIAGSAILGDWVLVGASSGIQGHLSVGSGTQIAALSGVIEPLPAGSKVAGYPAQPLKNFLRQAILLRHMVKKEKDKNKKN